MQLINVAYSEAMNYLKNKNNFEYQDQSKGETIHKNQDIKELKENISYKLKRLNI